MKTGSEIGSEGSMGDAHYWEVDRMAAAELLATLKEHPEAEWGVIAAEAIAKTRRQSYEWAAQRVRQSALAVLEREASGAFQHKEATWTDGFRHAEKCLMATSPTQLLGVTTRPAPTKGQVLRALLRSAKRGKASIRP